MTHATTPWNKEPAVRQKVYLSKLKNAGCACTENLGVRNSAGIRRAEHTVVPRLAGGKGTRYLVCQHQCDQRPTRRDRLPDNPHFPTWIWFRRWGLPWVISRRHRFGRHVVASGLQRYPGHVVPSIAQQRVNAAISGVVCPSSRSCRIFRSRWEKPRVRNCNSSRTAADSGGARIQNRHANEASPDSSKPTSQPISRFFAGAPEPGFAPCWLSF